MEVTVVTGAASGIGRATAERLTLDGRTVVGLDVDEAALRVVGSAIGKRFKAVVGDVGQRASHERAADAAMELGTLTGWVNVAGIATRTRAHDFVDSDLDRVLRVNLVGTALGCSVSCQRFLAEGTPGGIVNVSSTAAIAGYPAILGYAASKGGVDALTRQVAVDYGPAGIRCNGVRPGSIMTPILESLARNPELLRSRGMADGEALLQSYREQSPLGRMAEPGEVAGVISFLLSKDALFITGELINVDGGATAWCYRYPPDPDISMAGSRKTTSMARGKGSHASSSRTAP